MSERRYGECAARGRMDRSTLNSVSRLPHKTASRAEWETWERLSGGGVVLTFLAVAAFVFYSLDSAGVTCFGFGLLVLSDQNCQFVSELCHVCHEEFPGTGDGASSENFQEVSAPFVTSLGGQL